MSEDLSYIIDGGAVQGATTYLASPGGVLHHGHMAVLPAGYRSVDEMLAEEVFYVAHRGGSANWPELSMRAFTNAAWWGAGALEVSLNRTTDGVWYGLHDQTLDRTSGTNNLAGNTLTWAQVQQYQINGAEPYMRWEQLVEAYAHTHVFFVDPKYRQSTHRTEFLSMVENDIGTDRAVIKYSGTALGLAADAESRGFHRWGYYYQGEYDSGVMASTQSAWSILGMAYNASAPAWAAVMGYGKPVMGHIVATPAQATTALSRGAHGLMVSGVLSIIPPKLPWPS